MLRMWVLATAACNPIFGLTETVPPDGPPPPIGCSGKLFGSPVSLPPLLENQPEFDGQLSADGRELWLVSPDGRTLVISDLGDLTLLTRECP